MYYEMSKITTILLSTHWTSMIIIFIVTIFANVYICLVGYN